MTTPVVYNLIRGASFALEIRVPGEDFGTADISITADPGIPAQEVEIETSPSDTINLTAESTTAFLIGSHNLIVWAQWPESREAIISAVVVVTAGPEDETVESILDGGAPGTDFDEGIDGGEV